MACTDVARVVGIVSLAAAQSVESGVPGQLEAVARTVASESVMLRRRQHPY